MVPKAYFLSDIHLNMEKKTRTERLLVFFKSFNAENAPSHLFLLGDIFDLWLWKHKLFIDTWEPVISELVRLKLLGTEIHYFEGNHDLYLKSYFENHLGFKVHSDPININLFGHNLRLEHGDQMDPDDRGYLFLRWFLRTPPLRVLAKCLPSRWVEWIGQRSSSVSRDYTSAKKKNNEENIIEKCLVHAKKVHKRTPFDILIAGHIHLRVDEKLPSGARVINLGSWLGSDFKALTLDKEGYNWIDIS